MEKEYNISRIENELILMRATIQAYIEISMPKDEWLKVRDLAEIKYKAFIEEAINNQKN